MSKKNIENQDWYKDLKVKGMTDNQGHYVEMIEVTKDNKEYWHWSDGAITIKGLKRDGLFNFAYSLIKFWRLNKFLIRLTIIFLVIVLLTYGVKFVISLF